MSGKRAGFGLSRRDLLKAAAACAGAAVARPVKAAGPSTRVFDVAKYGAVGDGKVLDSPAIQRAIDEAAAHAGRAQVLVRGGKKYRVCRQNSIRPKLHQQLAVRGTNSELIFGVNDGVSVRVRTCRRSRILKSGTKHTTVQRQTLLGIHNFAVN
jgi:hypothetical protein